MRKDEKNGQVLHLFRQIPAGDFPSGVTALSVASGIFSFLNVDLISVLCLLISTGEAYRKDASISLQQDICVTPGQREPPGRTLLQVQMCWTRGSLTKDHMASPVGPLLA